MEPTVDSGRETPGTALLFLSATGSAFTAEAPLRSFPFTGRRLLDVAFVADSISPREFRQQTGVQRATSPGPYRPQRIETVAARSRVSEVYRSSNKEPYRKSGVDMPRRLLRGLAIVAVALGILEIGNGSPQDF